MPTSNMQVLAGTLLVDDGTAAPTAGAVPTFDANGNVFVNAPKSGVLNVTTTSATLTAGYGHIVYNGTAAGALTLPAESNAANLNMRVINGTSFFLSVAPAAGENINGSSGTVSIATSFGAASFCNDPTSTKGWVKS